MRWHTSTAKIKTSSVTACNYPRKPLDHAFPRAKSSRQSGQQRQMPDVHSYWAGDYWQNVAIDDRQRRILILIPIWLQWTAKGCMSHYWRMHSWWMLSMLSLFRLENKAPMPYRVWTEKLSSVVRQWYKALADCGRDVTKVRTNMLAKFVHMIYRMELDG